MKRVRYRKTSHGEYRVRTPKGEQSFKNSRHAKSFFRDALKEFKQVFIPRSLRKKKSFNLIREMTITVGGS